jgi:hypothetical protein
MMSADSNAISVRCPSRLARAIQDDDVLGGVPPPIDVRSTVDPTRRIKDDLIVIVSTARDVAWQRDLLGVSASCEARRLR